jgi:hypothetical protein
MQTNNVLCTLFCFILFYSVLAQVVLLKDELNTASHFKNIN